MDALDTALLSAALIPSIYLLVRMERARAYDPDHVRRFGATVARHALQRDETASVIGYYAGGEIFASVRYLGMTYRFECVVPENYRRAVGPRQLLVDPGLLYVTD